MLSTTAKCDKTLLPHHIRSACCQEQLTRLATASQVPAKGGPMVQIKRERETNKKKQERDRKAKFNV